MLADVKCLFLLLRSDTKKLHKLTLGIFLICRFEQCDRIFLQSSPIIWELSLSGYFEDGHFLRANCFAYILCNFCLLFGQVFQKFATFYSIIWSHWLRDKRHVKHSLCPNRDLVTLILVFVVRIVMFV